MYSKAYSPYQARNIAFLKKSTLTDTSQKLEPKNQVVAVQMLHSKISLPDQREASERIFAGLVSQSLGLQFFPVRIPIPLLKIPKNGLTCPSRTMPQTEKYLQAQFLRKPFFNSSILPLSLAYSNL